MKKSYDTYGVDAKSARKQSLTDEVYNALLEKFINKELAPGQVLNRRSVAKELNVSVAPVLEAFLYLEMEGYVETLPRKGTIVKPIRKEDIYEQLIMREAIECQAARMYAGRPLADDFDRLLLLAENVDGSCSDVVVHWEDEINFHSALVSLSQCKALIEAFFRVIRLGTFYNMHRIVTDSYPSADERENQSHRELLRRLKDRDADIVEGFIRDHLRSGKRELFAEFGQR